MSFEVSNKMTEEQEKTTIFKNEDIGSVLMEIPEGHQHIRTYIKTSSGNYVFQEATIAAIVRAYTTIKTHPQITKVNLIGAKLDNRKKGYASYQLMEKEID